MQKINIIKLRKKFRGYNDKNNTFTSIVSVPIFSLHKTSPCKLGQFLGHHHHHHHHLHTLKSNSPPSPGQ